MRRLLPITSYLLLASAAFGLTDPWDVNVRQHAAVDRTYSRGETVEMRLTFRDGFTPLNLAGATAQFLWYTNSSDNVWWANTAAVHSASAGIVSATWEPSMDVGATNYPYWVGLWMPGVTTPVWRASGTIRMLGSPGAVVNRRDRPVLWFDWSVINSTNAPWLTTADWQAGSNALASALQAEAGDRSAAVESNAQAIASHELRLDNPHAVTAEQTGAATPAAVTGIVGAAIAALPPPSSDARRLINADGTEWIDGTGAVWRVQQVATTNDDQRILWDSGFFPEFGLMTLDQIAPDQWRIYLDNDLYAYAGDIYSDQDIYVALGQTDEWPYGLTFYQALPADLTTWPKTYTRDNGQTGWVDRAISYQTVTSAVDRVRFASEGTVVFFTDVPLYVSGGTNYYWRFDSALGTYVITGVPQ